jgi:hypothetical protein
MSVPETTSAKIPAWNIAKINYFKVEKNLDENFLFNTSLSTKITTIFGKVAQSLIYPFLNLLLMAPNAAISGLNGLGRLLGKVTPPVGPILGYIQTSGGYKEVYRSDLTEEDARETVGTKEYEEAQATQVLADLEAVSKDPALSAQRDQVEFELFGQKE